jgi:hypothetical protein
MTSVHVPDVRHADERNDEGMRWSLLIRSPEGTGWTPSGADGDDDGSAAAAVTALLRRSAELEPEDPGPEFWVDDD